MRLAIVFLLVGILLFWIPVSATLINVPSQYSTIQAGINASVNGDTVLVDDGTYTGTGNRDIDFFGKSIILKSLNGPGQTIIDCQASQYLLHRGFKFHSGEDSMAVLDGFKIQNGYGPTDYPGGFSAGGGIICINSSSPLIKNCLIINNHSDHYAGGLVCNSASPKLLNCSFEQDSSSACGGLLAEGNSSLNLIGCSFEGNTGGPVGDGAGLYCIGPSRIALNQCSFLNNLASHYGGAIFSTSGFLLIDQCIFQANSAGQGGGIFLESSSIDLSNCLFDSNTSSWGGAIFSCRNSILTLSNCLLNRNQGGVLGGAICDYGNNTSLNLNNCTLDQNYGGLGGAIYDYGSNTSMNLTNCTLVNNSATLGGGILCRDTNSVISNCIIAFSVSGESIYGGNPSISCSDFYGNIGGDWIGDIAPQLGQNGNICSNPAFCDASEGDYHLSRSSPCAPQNNICESLIGAYAVECSGLYAFHLISPINNMILADMPSQFVWESTRDIDSGLTASYMFYIADTISFNLSDSSIILTDTTYSLSDTLFRSKRYYWKVRAFNNYAPPRYAEEIWSFYLDGYPNAPTSFAPQPGLNADSLTVFSWYISTDPDSFDAVSYTIQIDDDSAFASPEVNRSGLRSGMVIDDAFAIRLGELTGHESLQVDTRYFWRVRADDNYGLSSDWTDGSNWFVFMAQNHPPTPPDSGFSPSGGEEVISLTPLITWANASDPDPDDHAENLSYAIRLSPDSLFAGFVYYDTTGIGLNQISPVAELSDNTRYFYEIKTIDNGGLSSDWSARQDFWTNHYNFPPEPFLLYGPTQGERQVVYYTHFSWGSTIDYDPNSSFAYSIQFSPDSAFHWIQRQLVGLADTTVASIPTDSLALIVPQLYWRVVAVDDDSLIRIGGIPEQSRRLVILPAGDANANGTTNGLDVVYLVNYLKGLGPTPDPLLAGDANGNCVTNGLDVVYLVNYLKGLGPAPTRCVQ